MKTLTLPANHALRASNRRLVMRLLLVVAGSLLFVALQPQFYKAFCDWVGIYDLDRADQLAQSASVGRTIRLEFDANSFDTGLRFSPRSPVMTVKTGEVTLISFRVENTRPTPVIGQGVPSYGPQLAAAYVVKLECFCFRQQVFAPHEVRELPVVFIIDPKMPQDVATVTLSYAFFEVPAGSVQKASVGAKLPL